MADPGGKFLADRAIPRLSVPFFHPHLLPLGFFFAVVAFLFLLEGLEDNNGALARCIILVALRAAVYNLREVDLRRFCFCFIDNTNNPRPTVWYAKSTGVALGKPPLLVSFLTPVC